MSEEDFKTLEFLGKALLFQSNAARHTHDLFRESDTTNPFPEIVSKLAHQISSLCNDVMVFSFRDPDHYKDETDTESESEKEMGPFHFKSKLNTIQKRVTSPRNASNSALDSCNPTSETPSPSLGSIVDNLEETCRQRVASVASTAPSSPRSCVSKMV
ncbi:MAG: hypothetical protein ACTSUE_05240 [Promethearchaeota archaeon]